MVFCMLLVGVFTTNSSASANSLIDVFQFNTSTNWNSTILNKSLSYDSYRVFLNNTNTVITGNGTLFAMSGGNHNMDVSTGNVYNSKVSSSGFSYSFYSKPESYGCRNSFYIELGDVDNLIRLYFDVANDNVSLSSQGGGSAVKQFSSSCDNANYHFYVVNIESDLINIYKDGVLFYVITPNINIDFSDYYFNQFVLNGFDGSTEVYMYFTDFSFFDFLLSPADIIGIYNSGATVYNYSFATPANSNYVYITDFNQGGDNPINILGRPVYFDFIYNYCDTFDSNNDYIAVYKIGDVEISRQLTSSSQCSNFMTGDIYSAVSTATSTGTSTIEIYSAPYVLGVSILETPLEDLTFEATSQEFSSIVGEPSSYNAFINPRREIVPVTSATTTPFYYSGNYCNQDYSDSVSKICIDSLGVCSSISSCSIPIDSFIDIPMGIAGQSINSNFTLKDSTDNILFTSSNFLIRFSNSGAVDTVSPCDTSQTWYSEAFCNLSENTIKPMALGFVNELTNIFPFVFFKGVYQSWQDSATASLPSSFSFLPWPDNQGNMYLSIPDRFSGGSNVRMCIFGSCIFNQPALTPWFLGIRGLTTYGWYGLLIYSVYFLSSKIYKEIRE